MLSPFFQRVQRERLMSGAKSSSDPSQRAAAVDRFSSRLSIEELQKKTGQQPWKGSLAGQVLQSVGGKMEPLGETRKSQRATAQAFE